MTIPEHAEERLRPPTLNAYRDGDGLYLMVWCSHELRWHRHGSACACDDDPCSCFGSGDGHRSAHCTCRASPYRNTGYVLREVGELTYEILKRRPAEPSYSRGCTWDSCRLYREQLLEQAKNPPVLPAPDAPADVAAVLRRGYVDVHSIPQDELAYRPAVDVSRAASETADYHHVVSTAGVSWCPWPKVDVDDLRAGVAFKRSGEAELHDLTDGQELVNWRVPESDPMAALDEGSLILRRWRGSWMRWLGPHWEELEHEELNADLSARLKGAQWVKRLQKGPVVMPWQPNRNSLGEVAAALGHITLLPSNTEAPAWLANEDWHHPSREPIVACANGLLDTGKRQLIEHTPDYFNLVSVPFDFQAGAQHPETWLDFLHRLWPDDPASIEALQQWFGYVLSGWSHLQKILLLVGPPRAGKGTIARILTELVGRGHVASPTLAALSTNFGLQPLIGKPLGIVADARMAGRDTHVIVERLLSISGEDSLTIDRKYRDAWTGRLPTRLMVMSNELPNFGDASGAIATRFIALSLEQSWLGREDTGLERKLRTELPGILSWALDGLDQLGANGRFTEPPDAGETLVAMIDSASPMSAFVRECCQVGAGEQVPVAQLFAAWRGWCLENGRDRPGNQQTLGRNLRAILPAVRLQRPRDAAGQQVRTYAGLSLSRNETRQLPTVSQGFSQGSYPRV